MSKNKIGFGVVLFVISLVCFVSVSASPYGNNINLTVSDASFYGENPNDFASTNIEIIGDVNGDSYDDFAISAYGYNHTINNTGKIYLFYGSSNLYIQNISLANANASFYGEFEQNLLSIISGAGDFNGDSYDDFMFSSPSNNQYGNNTGKIYLFYGSSNLQLDTNVSSANFSIHGSFLENQLGIDLSGGFDVNNDGYSDILVSAPGESKISTMDGVTYLIYGSNKTLSSTYNISEIYNASFYGESMFDVSGLSIDLVGDVNGDSYDDFIIGSSANSESGANAGQTYLFLGNDSFSGNISLSSANASFLGENAGDFSGIFVSKAGDVNNDGYYDFLISSYLNSDYASESGKTYLILGKSTGWSQDVSLSTSNASFYGEYINNHAGFSLSDAGDVNNDDYDDFLIGSYDFDNFALNQGKTYLIMGHSIGWQNNINLSIINNSYLGEYLGDTSSQSVAGGGDVNNDGYSDIFISAHLNDMNGVSSGKSYLFYGSILACNFGTDCTSGVCIEGSCVNSCSKYYNNTGCSHLSSNWKNLGVCTKVGSNYYDWICDQSEASYYDGLLYSDCSLTDYAASCDNDSISITNGPDGYISNGICGGTNHDSCYSDYAISNSSSITEYSIFGDVSSICSSYNGYYCDDISDLSFIPGDKRCDASENSCDTCDLINKVDSSTNCESACGAEINSDEISPGSCDSNNGYVDATCLYFSDGDSNIETCNCIAGLNQWSLGGEVSALSCCGDDLSEFIIIENSSFDTPNNYNDSITTCCDAATDCNYNDNCYSTGSVSGGINPNNAFCEDGVWYGGDYSSDACLAMGNSWLADATGINSPCCGDDTINDDFEQSFNYGYSACVDGVVRDSGWNFGSILIHDGQFFSCNDPSAYDFDTDMVPSSCSIIENLYCNSDNTWKSTKPNSCSCNLGTDCTSGLCINGICRTSCSDTYDGITCSDDATNDYNSDGICTRVNGVWECDEFESALYLGDYWNDCDKADYEASCDNNSLASGFVANGICGGPSHNTCYNDYVSDPGTTIGATSIFGNLATVCSFAYNSYQCDDISDGTFVPGDKRCDGSQLSCETCDFINDIDSSGNCESACGADPNSDEKIAGSCDGSSGYVGSNCAYYSDGDLNQTVCSCMLGSWLADGIGANANCCGDDLNSDYFEQTTAAGRSACLSGNVVSDGSTSNQFIVSDGQIYSCNSASTLSVDDDYLTTTCLAVESLYCNSDNTWKTTKGNSCSCNLGTECSSGLCVNGFCRSSCSDTYDGLVCSDDGTNDYSSDGICARVNGVWECDEFESSFYNGDYWNDCGTSSNGALCDPNNLAGGYISEGHCAGADCCVGNYIDININDLIDDDESACRACSAEYEYYKCSNDLDFNWDGLCLDNSSGVYCLPYTGTCNFLASIIKNTTCETTFLHYSRAYNSSIYNSTFNSSFIFESYVNDTKIIHSTVRSISINNSIIDNSLVNDSYIKNSKIYASQICNGTSIIGSNIVNNIITSGRVFRGGKYFYEKTPLSRVCGFDSENLPAPNSVGYVTLNSTYINDSSSYKVMYISTKPGYSVSLDASSIGAGIINLYDDGSSVDEQSGDGIYSGLITVSTSNFNGEKSINATIGYRDNSWIVTKDVSVDNTNPVASLNILSLTLHDDVTYSSQIILNYSVSDNNKISKCRFANDYISNLAYETYSDCDNEKLWSISESSGIKTIYLQVIDSAGNSFITSDTIIMNNSVLTDTTPPSKPIVLDDGDYIHTKNSLSFDWYNATDKENGLLFIPLKYNYKLWNGTEYILEINETEHTHVTIKGLNLSEQNSYRLDVWAQNSVGLFSSISSSDGIITDFTNPSAVSLSASVPNNVWVNSNYANFNFSATDDFSGIKSFSYSVSANPTIVPDNVTDDITNLRLYNLGEGQYYLKVKASDNAGNFGPITTYNFKLDTTAPSIPQMHQNSITSTMKENITYSWTDSNDVSGVVMYHLEISEYSDFTSLIFNSTTGNSTSYTFNPPVNGTYYARVKSKNSLNLWSLYSSYVSSEIDRSPPKITIMRPISKSVSAYPLLFVKTDEKATCMYKNNSGVHDYTLFDLTGSKGHEVILPLRDGSYSYKIKCIDEIGNYAEEITSFSVDSLINVDSISFDSLTQTTFYSGNIINLNFSITSLSIGIENFDMDYIDLTLNGDSITTDFSYSDLGNGTYMLSMIAPDVDSGYADTFELIISTSFPVLSDSVSFTIKELSLELYCNNGGSVDELCTNSTYSNLISFGNRQVVYIDELNSISAGFDYNNITITSDDITTLQNGIYYFKLFNYGSSDGSNLVKVSLIDESDYDTNNKNTYWSE